MIQRYIFFLLFLSLFMNLFIIGIGILHSEETKGNEAEAGSPGDIEDAIVVTAEEPIERDLTQDLLSISGETLRNSAKPSVFESIAQESAGVYVSGKGFLHGVAQGASGSLVIRGLGGSPNSQVLVVEDGVPDFQGIFGHPIPDAYPPFLLEDVLVIEGGDSVLYGTNALAGVLVLRNRWCDQEGFEILNDSAYGSFNTLRESVAMLAHYGRVDGAISFFGLTTKGHRVGTGGDEAIGTTAVRYHLNPKSIIEIRNKILHTTGSDPGTVEHPNPDHWYDVWRDTVSVGYWWKSNHLRLSVLPYLNLGIHKLYDGFFSHDYLAGGIIEMDWEISPSWKVLVGSSTQNVGGNVKNRVDQYENNVPSLTDISLYNQLLFHIDPYIVISVGGRMLYSSAYDMVYLYKSGIKWNYCQGLYVRSSFKKNFRQPTLRELYLPFPTANPNLRPEYAFNLDAGLGYETEKFEASITGYRTHAKDMIHYFGSWPSAEVVNIDRITILGLEGMISLRKLKGFSANWSADMRDVGRYTRQNPSLKMDSTLGYERQIGSHFVAGTLSCEWVHGLYMANYKRKPINDVITFDATLRYQRFVSKRNITVEPYLILRNLLDRRNAFIEGYILPGFNILVGLKLGV